MRASPVSGQLVASWAWVLPRACSPRPSAEQMCCVNGSRAHRTGHSGEALVFPRGPSLACSHTGLCEERGQATLLLPLRAAHLHWLS